MFGFGSDLDDSPGPFSVATPAALAALAALNVLPTGILVWVLAMKPGAAGGLFILQPAISSTPDNFFIVPTLDDPTRQWAYNQIQEQGNVGYVSAELDLTVPQTLIMLPPLTGFRFTLAQVFQLLITQKNGTITTGPTLKVGTNATFDDVVAATIQAAGASNLDQAFNFVGGTTNPGPNNKDMTTNGLKLVITVGAVLGTATVWKARVRTSLAFAKY